MLTYSCVYLLDLADGILQDKHLVAVEDVVNIQRVHESDLDAGDVSGALVENVILLGKNDERLFAGGQCCENLCDFLER